jgi:glycosyltransferase involved in cell wall biosynthesis
LKRGLSSSDRIVVSPSGGINDKLFTCEGKKNKHDYFHLGYVGRLEKDKGIIEFIDACCILGKSFNLKATIIGYGTLNEVVAEKTKDNHIFTVLYGVPQAELPSYYKDFDLFCFPSSRKTESLGLVGIEAMGCGTPILGGNIGGIRGYVKHGVNGFLLGLNTMVNDIVAFSKDYINMPESRKLSMKENAVQTAKSYSRDKVCRELSDEFKKRISNN